MNGEKVPLSVTENWGNQSNPSLVGNTEYSVTPISQRRFEELQNTYFISLGSLDREKDFPHVLSDLFHRSAESLQRAGGVAQREELLGLLRELPVTPLSDSINTARIEKNAAARGMSYLVTYEPVISHTTPSPTLAVLGEVNERPFIFTVTINASIPDPEKIQYGDYASLSTDEKVIILGIHRASMHNILSNPHAEEQAPQFDKYGGINAVANAYLRALTREEKRITPWKKASLAQSQIDYIPTVATPRKAPLRQKVMNGLRDAQDKIVTAIDNTIYAVRSVYNSTREHPFQTVSGTVLSSVLVFGTGLPDHLPPLQTPREGNHDDDIPAYIHDVAASEEVAQQPTIEVSDEQLYEALNMLPAGITLTAIPTFGNVIETNGVVVSESEVIDILNNWLSAEQFPVETDGWGKLKIKHSPDDNWARLTPTEHIAYEVLMTVVNEKAESDAAQHRQEELKLAYGVVGQDGGSPDGPAQEQQIFLVTLNKQARLQNDPEVTSTLAYTDANSTANIYYKYEDSEGNQWVWGEFNVNGQPTLGWILLNDTVLFADGADETKIPNVPLNEDGQPTPTAEPIQTPPGELPAAATGTPPLDGSVTAGGNPIPEPVPASEPPTPVASETPPLADTEVALAPETPAGGEGELSAEQVAELGKIVPGSVKSLTDVVAWANDNNVSIPSAFKAWYKAQSAIAGEEGRDAVYHTIIYDPGLGVITDKGEIRIDQAEVKQFFASDWFGNLFSVSLNEYLPIVLNVIHFNSTQQYDGLSESIADGINGLFANMTGLSLEDMLDTLIAIERSRDLGQPLPPEAADATVILETDEGSKELVLPAPVNTSIIPVASEDELLGMRLPGQDFSIASTVDADNSLPFTIYQVVPPNSTPEEVAAIFNRQITGSDGKKHSFIATILAYIANMGSRERGFGFTHHMTAEESEQFENIALANGFLTDVNEAAANLEDTEEVYMYDINGVVNFTVPKTSVAQNQ